MIYKAHQIELWPRLLTATRQIDPVLADALEGLMEKGASLHPTQTGKLQIGAGTMAVEQYEAVRTATLAPRKVKLYRLLSDARGLGHPWLQSVAKALKDLEARCATGDRALADAALQHDAAKFGELLPTVAARHYQANLLAQALFTAGFGQYDKTMSVHLGVWMELAPKIPGGPHPAYGWPVDTPDGWFWIVENARLNGQPFLPPAVTLDKKQGPKAWLEDEPLISDWELANALARSETGASWLKEAG